MNVQALIPIIIYLLVLLAVGVGTYVLNRRRQTEGQAEYFLGGRKLGPLLLTFTILASAASSGTFIGAPGVAYDMGFAWGLVIVTQVGMGVYILGVLGKRFSIVARKIGAVTLTDFLKARFESNTVVLLTTFGIIVFLGAYMVAQFVGGAIILEAVTGLQYEYGLLLFGLIVVLFTTIGGFMAVALTDALSGILMLLGGVVIWIAFFVNVGSFASFTERMVAEVPHLVELPGTGDINSLLVASYFLLFGIAAIGLPHASVRGMSFDTSKTMHRSMYYSGIIMLAFSLFFITLGPFARLLYPDLDNADTALPTLILGTMPDWAAGIVLAAPLAAVISTVNSMLLVASSAVVRDVYREYIQPSASPRRMAVLSYAATFVIGIVVVAFSFTPPDFLQLIVIYAIGGLEATFFAPIVFGLYWRRANAWGAITSMVVGLVSYVAFEMFLPFPFGMHTIVTSTVLSIATMVAVSYATPPPPVRVIQALWGYRRPATATASTPAE